MIPTGLIRVIVKFTTRDEAAISAIRKRFRLPVYTTLNGWTPGMIEQNDLDVFEETARRGFFTFIRKKWTYNGATYSW